MTFVNIIILAVIFMSLILDFAPDESIEQKMTPSKFCAEFTFSSSKLHITTHKSLLIQFHHQNLVVFSQGKNLLK